MQQHVDHVSEYTPEEVAERFTVDDMLEIFKYQATQAPNPERLVAQPLPEKLASQHYDDLHMLFANTLQYQDNPGIQALINNDTIINALKEQRHHRQDPQDIVAAVRIRRTTLAYLYTYVPHVFQIT